MSTTTGVEELVIAWLGELSGNDWPVYGDKPQQVPKQFILVDRTGGPREAMVLDRAEILIEVYDKDSRLGASNRASAIADAIVGLEAFNHDITHADVNSLVNLDDTIGQYHRYQIYCDVYHRR
ncbi:hypothetical protein [Polynucleobacter sp.]|uniref:hypothetical protein n=1 Tax=Polynucleobacter sp. TaxID=2029855 RepID=UPI003F6A3215